MFKSTLPVTLATRIWIGICFFIIFTLPGGAQSQVIKFTDITDAKEVWGNRENGVSCYGHGVAMADITGDFLPDIYISNAVRNANKLPEVLYISQKNGPYIENDYARGVDDNYGKTGSHGIIFADYDNDGDYDIFNATTDDRIRLYRNRGDGYFDDVSDAANIPASGLGTRGIVAFDANNDGFLDLLGVNWGPVEDENNVPQITPPQPNEFYLNNGNGTFSKKTNTGLTPINPSNIGTQGVTAIDVDNDGDMDVFVSHRNYSYLGKDENGNDLFGPDWSRPVQNELFINDGTGHFTEEAVKRGIYYDRNDCNGTTFADYDNDGDLDVFVVQKQKYEYVRVYRNKGNGYFEDVTFDLMIRQWGFSLLMLDVDNDGDLDAYTMNVRRRDNTLYINDGNGEFDETSNTGLEKYCFDPRGGSVGDVDDDGDQDIYFVDANKFIDPAYGNYLLRNDTQTNNRWLKVYGRGPKGDMGGFGTKIWVFDQGYMEDSSHLVGYRQVINAYGYLCQDDPVQHFGLGQRDTVDVKIQMLDGTTLKAFNVPANRKIFFSKPGHLQKYGGDGQQGSHSQVLPDPLQVKVTDPYGNPVIGVPVQFQVTNDNGSFVENLPVYTDYNGIAQVRYVVGSMNIEQYIRATSPLIPNQAVDFTVYATDIGPSSLVLISQQQMSGTVGTVLSDSVKVRIVNEDGQGLARYDVNFKVVAGAGSLLPEDTVSVVRSTNGQGYATVAWRLGTNASQEQKLEITSEINGQPLDGSPIYVTATAAAGQVATMIPVSGDGQTGTVGQPVHDSLVVRVMDDYQNSIAGLSVRFKVISGNGLVDGSDSATTSSDENGRAAVQWQLGSTAGQQQVQAFVVDQPSILTTFTALARHADAHELLYVGPSEYSGVVGEALTDSIAVQVVDKFDNVVDSFAVTFQITSGGGQVNGTSSATVMTDKNGFAKCQWQLGSKAGRKNNVLRIAADELIGSPITLYASARHGEAAEMKGGPFQGLQGIVGKPLTDSLAVQIVDSFDNAVDSFAVDFSVTKGQGLVNGQHAVQVLTDSSGYARCQWQLGPTAGDSTNELSIRADGLAGSPINVLATALADHAYQLQKVSGDKQSAPPNAQLQNPLIVAVVDTFGNPVSGHPVIFAVTSGDATFNSQTSITDTTDEQGRAQAMLQLGVHAGPVTVTVSGYYQGASLLGSPVTFTATIGIGDFDPQKSILTATSPVIANGRDQAELRFYARDQFNNPVSGLKVEFHATGEQNLFVQPQASTDSAGIAIGYLASTRAEMKKVWVSSADQSTLLDSTTVYFVPTEAAEIQKVAGDEQTGVAGSVLDSLVVVALLDSFQNPISGAEITAVHKNPAGDTETLPPHITDEQGKAYFIWTLSRYPGVHQLTVSYRQLLSAVFTATAVIGPPALLKKYSGDGQIAKPGSWLAEPLVAQVTDKFLNPVANVEVLFRVKSGDGVITPTEPVRTDTLGRASAQWKLGTKGIQVVEAHVVGHDSISTQFYAYFAGNHAPIISCLSDTTILETETLTFFVKAIDQDGDSVTIRAESLPEGALFNEQNGQFVWTPTFEQAGHYQAVFTARDARGKQASKTVNITVLNRNRQPEIESFQPADTVFTVDYGQQIYFRVKAVDPDGDSLSYNWYFDGVPVPFYADSFKIIIHQSFPLRDSVYVRVSDRESFRQVTWRFELQPQLVDRARTPHHFALGQNYPNPFNPETTIEFSVPAPSHVSIKIFNTAGQLIRVLADNEFQAGTHRLVWDARNQAGNVVPSGIYYYEMHAGDFSETKKLLLLK